MKLFQSSIENSQLLKSLERVRAHFLDAGHKIINNLWKFIIIIDGHLELGHAFFFKRQQFLLTFFAVRLDLFPTSGITDPASDATGLSRLLDQAWHMALPCATLAIAYVGEYALVMRSSLIDVMREDYLTLARAKGLRDIDVRNRHAVRNALLPSTALIAINFGFVISGAIAVETVFSWPGLGLLTYESLRGPDLPMLQGLFLVFSASVILFNLLANLLYPLLDPRVRYQ